MLLLLLLHASCPFSLGFKPFYGGVLFTVWIFNIYRRQLKAGASVYVYIVGCDTQLCGQISGGWQQCLDVQTNYSVERVGRELRERKKINNFVLVTICSIYIAVRSRSICGERKM